MTGQMSSRQRLLAAIRRQEVDYVPCSPNFNPLTPVQRRGHKWQFPWPADATLDQRIAYQVGELGLDPTVHVGVDTQNPAAGVERKTWLEGETLHNVWLTPAGELHACVRYNDMWPHGQNIPLFSDFNIGHFIEPWIKTERDLACLAHVLRAPDGESLARVREGAEAARTVARRHGLALSGSGGMGLTGAQHLFGVAELCIATLERPELVDAYLEYEHRINLRMIEILADLGADIVHRNGFYETADFYGPQMLEKFLGDRLRRESEAVRQAGMVTAYTVHTGVAPIADYLAGLTMECLFGIDIVFHGMDLAKFRDKMAGRKSFWIGPSSTFHIWKGPDATRQAVRTVFEVIGKKGLILSQCVSSHSIMPWESALAMIDEWRKLR